MKKLVVLFLVSLMAASAFATIDPDPDQIGVYFDMTADATCATGAGAPVDAYVIATGITAVDFNAVEFTRTIEGTPGGFFVGADVFDNGGVNLSTGGDDYHVGYVTPFPGNGGNVVVLSFAVIPFGADPINIYLSQSTPESIFDGLPAYGELNGTLHSLGVSSGDVSMPVAIINGDCPVANEDLSFGSVKSLFR